MHRMSMISYFVDGRMSRWDYGIDSVRTCLQDTDTFIALLDRVKTTGVEHSIEENMALIDSKIQYLNEVRAETAASRRLDESSNGQMEEVASSSRLPRRNCTGLSVACDENGSLFPPALSFITRFQRVWESFWNRCWRPWMACWRTACT